MHLLSRLRIGTRLLAAFAFVLVLTLAQEIVSKRGRRSIPLRLGESAPGSSSACSSYRRRCYYQRHALVRRRRGGAAGAAGWAGSGGGLLAR